MPSQSQIRDEVTARIVQTLEADLLPWRRPWRAAGGIARRQHIATHLFRVSLHGNPPCVRVIPQLTLFTRIAPV